MALFHSQTRRHMINLFNSEKLEVRDLVTCGNIKAVSSTALLLFGSYSVIGAMLTDDKDLKPSLSSTHIMHID